MIYLDNAATTLQKPSSVSEAVIKAMTSMGNAARGAYGSALGAARIIYDTRVKLAKLFGCADVSHVVFTANATEALNIAIFGTLGSGDHVITTDLEHNSVLRPLYAMEKEQGVKLDFVRADERGCVKYEDFEMLMRPDTKAVVCTHASNLTGNLLDIGRIGKMAKEHGLLFLVDASQTAGAIPINMEEMGIDILCFTGHKGLMGPQGTGGLCIRKGIEIRPWKRGGSGVHSYQKEQPEEYPTRLEAGTLNSHGLAGLSAALDFIEQTGLEKIGEREQSLMRRFFEGIRKIKGVHIYGDFSSFERAAIVALNIWDYDSGEVADELSEDYHISVRAGAHCAPRMHEALHTTKQGAVRFSFSWFNTEEEIDAAIEAVKAIAASEES